MSKKKKSGSSMAAAAKDGNPIAAIGMKLTEQSVHTAVLATQEKEQAATLAANAKTNTLTSRPERARGFFSQQANTARKYLLGQ